MHHSGLLKAIRIFGSQKALAKALGVRQQSVSNWLNRESKISYLQIIKIVLLSKGKITLDEMAPHEKELNQSFYDLVELFAESKIFIQSRTSADDNQVIYQSTDHYECAYLELLLPFCKHAYITLINNNEGTTMTREYSKISPQFWVGKTGREILKLSVESRFLAFYLMTCPHANMIGIYYLPLAYIAHDVRINEDIINQALSELITVGFCSYDYSAEHVWVHEMAKYQVCDYLEEKDKRVKGLMTSFVRCRI